MVVKYSKGPNISQHFPFHDPPKYTQIGIFGLKRNHLATLCLSRVAALATFEPIEVTFESTSAETQNLKILKNSRTFVVDRFLEG
jgi:hypothetical protein